MNRKDFLKNCACGVCSCAAVGTIAPNVSSAAEEAPKPEDWRFQFVKRRYAKLLENLSAKVDAKTLDEILVLEGSFCASGYGLAQQYKGDVEGFIKEFREKTKHEISYDREKGVLEVVDPEKKECFCPLVDGKYTPAIACNCSVGWHKQTWETVLGKKVNVTLKESLLRGGKRCAFTVTIA